VNKKKYSDKNSSRDPAWAEAHKHHVTGSLGSLHYPTP